MAEPFGRLIGVLVLVVLCSPMGVPLQAQVPYGEYENWIGTDSTFEDPQHWSSLNEVHFALGYSEMTIIKSNDPLEGNHAMALHTRRLCYTDSMVCYLVPGVSVLGDLIINPSDLSITTPGVPFFDRPEALNGYFKYFPVEGDSARIVVELSHAASGGERRLVGRGIWMYGDLMEQYSFLNIPIEYVSEDAPDKLRIFIYSGIRNMEYPSPYPVGSRLLVDWIKMGPNVIEPPDPTLVWTPDRPETLRLYPQPARNGHYLDGSAFAGQTLRIECWDLQGRLLAVQDRAMAPIPQWVDWSSLPAGSYRLVLRSPEGAVLGTAPLMLQR
jgi:hypothetical protein